MAGPIWVLAQGDDGRPSTSTLELVTRARDLGDRVDAFWWGPGAAAAAADLGAHGAGRVLDLGELGGALPGAPVAAAMAARMATDGAPSSVLFATSYDGRDVAARLSARIDRPVLGNVVDLTPGDPPMARHALFGGATLVTARFTGPRPHLFLVRPKSFTAEPSGGAPAEVVPWEVPDVGATGGARVVERHVEDRSGPKLDEAAVVVSGGRGLGEPSRFELVEELARLLGGAAGATRAIVDAGWVPYARQVGQTGTTVKPTLYIACGISGATQHMVGMKGARHIVAINKDREAPIFSIADVGVVGDVAKVLPKLIDAIRARRG